jgi:hypothetical protein
MSHQRGGERFRNATALGSPRSTRGRRAGARGIAILVGLLSLSTEAAAQGGQAPVAPVVDSLRLRLEDAEAAIALLREQLGTEAEAAVRTRSRVALEWSGTVVTNVFTNTRRTNNADLPLWARADSGTGPQGGMGMSVRQTRLALAVGVREVAGGTFTGDLDVDFYGGQMASNGGRTFPLLRVRTARAVLDWAHAQLLVGQEQPLVAGLNPVSLASVGISGFSGSGNLWLWLPQVRGTVQTAGRVRVALQSAVVAPSAGEPVTPFDVAYDAAERTGRPAWEGQGRIDWGTEARPAFVALGVHHGTVANASDIAQMQRAVTTTWRVPIGARIELRGEAFEGQGLRGLGGGGIYQGIGVGGRAIRTTGGWGQLNVTWSPRLLVGTGVGYDDPVDADVPTGGRLANRVREVHVHLRPAGPLLLGLEWRDLTSTIAAGPQRNRHLNLAMGFEF